MSQLRSWPRRDAFFDNGSPILGVPDAVQNATNQLAYFIVAEIPRDENAMAHIVFLLQPVIVEATKH
jgi:hypothetical protein